MDPDPDPGGRKTYGSDESGFGSATLGNSVGTGRNSWKFWIVAILYLLFYTLQCWRLSASLFWRIPLFFKKARAHFSLKPIIELFLSPICICKEISLWLDSLWFRSAPGLEQQAPMSERPPGILKRAVAFSTSPPSSFISARSTGVPARASGPAQSSAMPAQSPAVRARTQPAIPARTPAVPARTPAVPAVTRPVGASLETALRSWPPLEDTDSDGDTASIVELPSDQVGTEIDKKA